MEELRSTDILDKEIQSDARKKAEAIMASGKTEVEKILAEVSPRLEKAKAERVKTYEEKEAKYKKDIEASVPLEKQRFLVSFIADSVNEALNNYLKKLSQSDRLEIVLKPLAKSADFLKDKKFNAAVYGFDAAAAQKQVEKALGQKLISCKKIDAPLCDEDAIKDINEGIILESEDSGIKCRFTMEETISELKDKHYKELVDALFGGRL